MVWTTTEGEGLATKLDSSCSLRVKSPSPSVVVQTMLGPVFKTYRILDLRDDNRLVAMTETGPSMVWTTTEGEGLATKLDSSCSLRVKRSTPRLRDDNRLVAMTESGDVKQGLPVITQGHLFKRISDAFHHTMDEGQTYPDPL
jgi:hypothetical protein